MTRVLTVLALLCGASAGIAGTGDITGDGVISSADTRLALKIVGGLVKPTTAQQAAADVAPDGLDGAVRIADAVKIARMSLGLDPPIATAAVSTTLTLTVSGNATQNILLPGAYPVAGKLTDLSNTVFTGAIAFANTTTGTVFGPASLDTTTGAFSVPLPAGVYQPVAVTHKETTNGSGEVEKTDTAMAVGTPLTVFGPVSNLTLKRAALPTPPVLTLNFTGVSAPQFATSKVYLTDTGGTASTYRLNDVSRDVTLPPASINVPAGKYYVEVATEFGVSSGASPFYYVMYYNPLTVTGATSTTLNFPQLYELGGAVTSPTANPPIDFYSRLQPTGTADTTASYTLLGSANDYLVGIQPGQHIFSIGITSPNANTLVYFMLPYTMLAHNAIKNIAVPPLPAFRTIQGKVTQVNGSAAANVAITASSNLATIPAGGAFSYTATATSSFTGAYTLYLPDGTYTVTAAP
ncbi:MAG TPA: dockerin type I repeat-containing protein [Armatimonadota bacterium]